MSAHKILAKLSKLHFKVNNSLIYMIIDQCDKVTFSGNTIYVYAEKRKNIADVFYGRTIMKITLNNGLIGIFLPYFSDNVMFQCKIDKRYLNGKAIKLTNVFVNIYNCIFEELARNNIYTPNNSLFMIGIDNKRNQIIRVYHKGNTYIDLVNRLMPQFLILFENIIYFRLQYKIDDVLRMFSGAVICNIINDDMAKGLVYIKSDVEMRIDELERFPSLKYADIVCEYDLSLCIKYSSLRINNIQIHCGSPYDSFIKCR